MYRIIIHLLWWSGCHFNIWSFTILNMRDNENMRVHRTASVFVMSLFDHWMVIQHWRAAHSCIRQKNTFHQFVMRITELLSSWQRTNSSVSHQNENIFGHNPFHVIIIDFPIITRYQNVILFYQNSCNSWKQHILCYKHPSSVLPLVQGWWLCSTEYFGT